MSEMVNRPLCDLDRMRGLMDAEAIDVVVTTSPANFYYLSACYLLTQENVPERLALTVIPADSQPVVIVNEIEEVLVREESCISDVRAYKGAEEGFKRDPLSTLVDVLNEKGLERSKIGLELTRLPASYFQRLSAMLPKASLVDSGALLAQARMIKTRREIEILRKAAKKTERAMIQAYQAARAGDSEVKVAGDILSGLVRLGEYGPKFTCTCCFTTTNLVHAGPTHRRLERGDHIFSDISVRWPCYFSDVGRSAVVGKGENEKYPVYRKLAKINYELIESLFRPGVEVSRIYDEWARRSRAAGIPGKLFPHIGHSIGIDVHEFPMINPVNQQILEPNMVMSLEPVARHKRHYFHVENTILITKTGYELFTDEIRAEQLFEI